MHHFTDFLGVISLIEMQQLNLLSLDDLVYSNGLIFTQKLQIQHRGWVSLKHVKHNAIFLF